MLLSYWKSTPKPHTTYNLEVMMVTFSKFIVGKLILSYSSQHSESLYVEGIYK